MSTPPSDATVPPAKRIKVEGSVDVKEEPELGGEESAFFFD
jgi:hypothetical protein